MSRRTCLPYFVVAVSALAGLVSCSSKPSGSETGTKAPLKLDKIHGKVQIQLQPSASEAGLNMVISHEDTYWNDRDDTKDLTSNALYRMKTDYILTNDMIIWRMRSELADVRERNDDDAGLRG